MNNFVFNIVSHLRRLQRPAADQPLEAHSASIVLDVLQQRDLPAPLSVAELYSVYGGTLVPTGSSLDDAHFFPGFYWLSLADATAVYDRVSVDPEWDSRWFPIFANGGGDFYCVVCDPTSGAHGKVVGFILGEPEQDIEYLNVEKMLETISACFDRGAYFLSEGILQADYSAAALIAADINHGLPFYEG